MVAAFSKGFQTHRFAVEFSLLKILKCLYVTKATVLIMITCLWRWCSKAFENANKVYGRNFVIFGVFSVPFTVTLTTFF